MHRNTTPESPFLIRFSFSDLIKQLEKDVSDNNRPDIGQLRADLQLINTMPALRSGITAMADIDNHEELIGRLLKDFFPPALTDNEIKAVTVPYSHLVFNHTRRFKNILAAAGQGFTFDIRDFDDHQFYVLSCCLILNELYGTALDFSKPLFYDIPTANGVNRHYRILYNADFLEIYPTERALKLTATEVNELINNYDDLDLWKRKFPVNSYTLEGFAIMSLVDVTVENAVSIFKEKLLTLQAVDFHNNVEDIFRSIYRNPDINIGFSVLDEGEETFSDEGLGYEMKSYLLEHSDSREISHVLCRESRDLLLTKQKYFAISDISAYARAHPESFLAKRLQEKDVHSVILAPVVKNNHIFGILEVVSPTAHQLNSINANKLDVIMPFLTDTVQRLIAQFENRIRALIQSNYTSIHPSVYWKFREAARLFIPNTIRSQSATLPEITFQSVYPLYGEIDVKSSSDTRNESTRQDLQLQLETVINLIGAIDARGFLVTDRNSIITKLRNYQEQLNFPINAGTEQYVTQYLENEVHALLDRVPDESLASEVLTYFQGIDKDTGAFYKLRRKYDETIRLINDALLLVLDRSQVVAQEMIPHYFERFKTDGVDFSMYVGESIARAKQLTPRRLAKVRLWQLQTLCEMERAHFTLRPNLPHPLDVTSLVLVSSTPLSIRFRMDEKRFDVDGSYNARFEILKKRIDKVHIKGSLERLTAPGVLAIVYTDSAEAEEYRQYLAELNVSGFLEKEVSDVELEDLQGVSGLRALRVRFARPS